MQHIIYKTVINSIPCGPVVLVWRKANEQPQITNIIISRPVAPANREIARLFPKYVSGSCSEIDNICSKIRAALAGEKINFSLELIQFDACSGFQQAVLLETGKIPRGSVASYSFLAARTGSAKAGRAVGTALATNPFPILIPCHRVVRSDRTLGGFGGGPEMKRALLTAEGVTFDKTGRIAKHHFNYQSQQEYLYGS
ncbi:MAG: methylated-DNA--[protein]-cysteine S-methyltransferase [Deltaproteobacteria bacterium]|nr:methylated-DNA--[protein]-cysteine S-methyltransferase [Candidatus Tharpella sp.]